MIRSVGQVMVAMETMGAIMEVVMEAVMEVVMEAAIQEAPAVMEVVTATTTMVVMAVATATAMDMGVTETMDTTHMEDPMETMEDMAGMKGGEGKGKKRTKRIRRRGLPSLYSPSSPIHYRRMDPHNKPMGGFSFFSNLQYFVDSFSRFSRLLDANFDAMHGSFFSIAR